MKTAGKVGEKRRQEKGTQGKGGMRRSATKAKQAQLESEHALAKATATVPVIMDDGVEKADDHVIGHGNDPDVGSDVGAMDANTATALSPGNEAEHSVEHLAEPGEPTASVMTASAPPGMRPGVVLSPLAARMLQEEENARPKSRAKATSKATSRDLGPAYRKADTTVKEITEKIAQITATTRVAVDAPIGAQITELRRQLRTLRIQKKAALAEAGGEQLTDLRAQLKAAKAQRAAAREKALAGDVTGDATADSGAGPEATAPTVTRSPHVETVETIAEPLAEAESLSIVEHSPDAADLGERIEANESSTQ